MNVFFNKVWQRVKASFRDDQYLDYLRTEIEGEGEATHVVLRPRNSEHTTICTGYLSSRTHQHAPDVTETMTCFRTPNDQVLLLKFTVEVTGTHASFGNSAEAIAKTAYGIQPTIMPQKNGTLTLIHGAVALTLYETAPVHALAVLASQKRFELYLAGTGEIWQTLQTVSGFDTPVAAPFAPVPEMLVHPAAWDDESLRLALLLRHNNG
ncbi:hypothetical protein [Chrysiogenes arsenatis]|uniref:hypothetical protein n=1 Tax=Chrysiogenes arsenatis TaxID=309797 RepID=UPI000409DB14|nr:hypothetical protein [Chrysiogenes arsenatis]